MMLPRGDQVFLSQCDPSGSVSLGSSDAYAWPPRTPPIKTREASAASTCTHLLRFIPYSRVQNFSASDRKPTTHVVVIEIMIAGHAAADPDNERAIPANRGT